MAHPHIWSDGCVARAAKEQLPALIGMPLVDKMPHRRQLFIHLWHTCDITQVGRACRRSVTTATQARSGRGFQRGRFSDSSDSQRYAATSRCIK